MILFNPKILLILFISIIFIFLSGCSSVLPTRHVKTISQWDDFTAAKIAYEKVIPGKTTIVILKGIGFDPYSNPNIMIENYLKVRERFDPYNNSDKFPASVNKCLSLLSKCYAYVAQTGHQKEKRIGNAFLDVAGFRQKTHITGWDFEAIFVIHDDIVIYKLWSGFPQKNKLIDEKKPLGPLQSVGPLLTEVINPF